MTSLALFFFFSFSPHTSTAIFLSFPFTNSAFTNPANPAPLPLTSSPLLSPPLALHFFFHQRDSLGPYLNNSLLLDKVSTLSTPPANQFFPFPPAYHHTCLSAPPSRPIPWKGSRPGAIGLPCPTLLLAFSSLSLNPLSLRRSDAPPKTYCVPKLLVTRIEPIRRT